MLRQSSDWRNGTPSSGSRIEMGRWRSLTLALWLGVGLAFAPTPGHAAGDVQPAAVVEELPAEATKGLGIQAPGHVRVIELVDPANRRYDLRTFANGGIGTHKWEADADDAGAAPPIVFSIDENAPGGKVKVSAEVPRSWLLQFEDPGDPLEVISVSVVVHAGNSCVWDCYYVNGKKICECIED